MYFSVEARLSRNDACNWSIHDVKFLQKKKHDKLL